MIADDLFAGAGGWDLAAAALGIEARGVENMPEARATRDIAGLSTIHDDVWTFEPDGKATGLIASPPCQTFSAAGKGAGRKALDDVLRGIRDGYVTDLDHLRFLGLEVGDERTALVLAPLHFALAGGYEWLAWEQVPTVLPVWEACADVLRREGWNVWTGVLNAEQYGVPQTRRRATLLASRVSPVGAPTPTHSRYYPRTPEKIDPGVQKWVSMEEALGFGMTHGPYPTIACSRTSGGPDKEKVGGSAARAAIYAERAAGRWVLRGSNQANAAVRATNLPAPTMLFGHCLQDVRWYRAGTTTPGVSQPAGERDPESTRIELDEVSVLQTFPADYQWQGTQSRQFLQVGNAVPPVLGFHALAVPAGVDAREVAA